jgi:hypothetical protein
MPPKKAAAARGETDPKPKTIEFAPARDAGKETAEAIELTLPPTLSGDLFWGLADLEESAVGAAALLRVLRSILGADQVEAVREKVIADGVTFQRIDEVPAVS